MVGFNFAPQGWATCDGQLLSISQNTALFALLGTQFGGNGQTTFGLPDLRGRVPIHQGQGLGLTSKVIGEVSGVENHTLSATEMPQHQHTVTVTPRCSADDGTQATPQNNFPAVPSGPGGTFNAYAASAGVNMGAPSVTCGPAGQSQPHNNMQPYLVVNFVIALNGIFPSRN